MKSIFPPSVASTAALAIALVACPSRAQWVPANGQGGSIVRCFADDNDVVIAGTNAGIIRSTDSGITWKIVTAANISVYSILGIGNVLLAGTDSGEYRSTDAGASWTNIGLKGRTSDLFFAFNGVYLFASNGSSYVFRSRDSGITWESANGGLVNEGAYVNSIAAIGTELFAGGTASYGTVTTFPAILHSTDNGNNWTDINNSFSSIKGRSVASLAVIAKELFATTDSGVFLSTDKGVTWESIMSKLPLSFLFVNALLSTRGVLYVCTDSGLIFSLDSGATWSSRSSGLTNKKILTALEKNGRLFVGTKGTGVSYSVNDGQNWIESNTGIKGLYVRSLLHDRENLYAGTSAEDDEYAFAGGGILRSTDNGDHWSAMGPGPIPPSITTIAVVGNALFAGGYRSIDSGASWLLPDSVLNGSFITSFHSFGRMLFASTFDRGIFRSLDTGNTWQPAASGLGRAEVLRLESIGQILFAGTYSGMFRSTDSGNSWTQVNSGLTDTLVLSLGVLGNKIFAGTEAGVFLSSDSGATWHDVNNGLSQPLYIYAFAISGENIFVAGNGNVFLTRDNGLHWTNVSANLPNEQYTSVDHLTIDDMYLYAHTYHQGDSYLWRRPLSEMIGTSAVEQNPVLTQSLRIYPNPTSSSTTISLTPEAISYADISIVNLLGQEVGRVYSGVLDASEHRFTWEAQAKACTTGVYQCVVRMNGRVQTLPIVVE